MRDILCELQDMRHLDWAARKMSPGTPGCFLKAYEEVNGKRLYYKLSNYDSYRGVFGHECVNELIVSRVMNVLGIPHVMYQLIHAQIILDGKEEETSMYQMFCIDYLIANRDRHGSNLEVLRNDEEDSVRIAPLFDQGVSLLFSTYGDEKLLENVDVMRDFPVNNYIGAKSLEYNLSLIPRGYNLQIHTLKKEDRDYIFKDINNILSEKHINKIWEMIWKRWCYFEKVCNQEK